MKKLLILTVVIIGIFAITMPAFSEGDKSKDKFNAQCKDKAQCKEKVMFQVEAEQINLTYEIKDGAVHLKWNKCGASACCGYKVVHSTTNKDPKYPKDKYVKWETNLDKTEFVHKPNAKKSKVSFEGENYYRICALPNGFDRSKLNYCGISNVVVVKGSEIKASAPAKSTRKVKKPVKEIKTNKCNGCNHVNPKAAKFCNECGSKL